jgi:hypothetical protein
VGVYWNSLAQDRDKLWVFMNTVMDFRVPQKQVVSGLAEELLVFEGFFSM